MEPEQTSRHYVLCTQLHKMLDTIADLRQEESPAEIKHAIWELEVRLEEALKEFEPKILYYFNTRV